MANLSTQFKKGISASPTTQFKKGMIPWNKGMTGAKNPLYKGKDRIIYHPMYPTWSHIRNRCQSKKNKAYQNYGGRGIKVCERWQNSFLSFLEDMGDKPKGKSLDRIDNNGDYCKENCRWATSTEQGRNKRNNCLLKGKTISEWSEILGIKRSTLSMRYYAYGWSVDDVLSI